VGWEEREGGRWEEGGRMRKSNGWEVGDGLGGVGGTAEMMSAGRLVDGDPEGGL